VTRQGFRDQHIIYADKRTDLRGETYYWLGFHGRLSRPPGGTDLRAIYEGRIAVTPLHIDLTHEPALSPLSAWFPKAGG
jgi:5'-nucleotidase